MSEQLLWGDMHAHCHVGYGRGTVQRAFAAPREHLDSCSVTGRAPWHDMPSDRSRNGEVSEYHREGFARLRRTWRALRRPTEAHHREGPFSTCLSYEWHPTTSGDHNVTFPGTRGSLREAADPDALARAVANDGALPNHHTMEPRVHAGTVARGLELGHRFGLIGGAIAMAGIQATTAGVGRPGTPRRTPARRFGTRFGPGAVTP